MLEQAAEGNLLIERKPIEVLLSKIEKLKKSKEKEVADSLKAVKRRFLMCIFWYTGKEYSLDYLCMEYSSGLSRQEIIIQEVIIDVLRKFSDQELVTLATHLIQESVKRTDYIKKTGKRCWYCRYLR
ncbi:MAG: hypothetical protein HYT61_01325 [Candidatus Yanofskybacteria bacterium]|nr:hypothetical protein [Candidatus Yanofskybacteria bacterium]